MRIVELSGKAITQMLKVLRVKTNFDFTLTRKQALKALYDGNFSFTINVVSKPNFDSYNAARVRFKP